MDRRINMLVKEFLRLMIITPYENIFFIKSDDFGLDINLSKNTVNERYGDEEIKNFYLLTENGLTTLWITLKI